MTTPVSAAPMPKQNPTLGVLWMLVTGLCFVAMTASVKLVGDDVPPAQAAFLRYIIGLAFFIPVIPMVLRTKFTKRALGLFGLRGAVHSLGVICWFFAMTQIPVAEVTAMNYLNPIYVSVLAVLFLGERMAIRRILAVCVALMGAFIILRPGFRELGLGHFAMILTALCFAFGYLITKIMANETTPTIIVFMLSVTVTIGLLPFALANWVSVGWYDLGLLCLTAVFATAGHYTMTLAFSMAPLSVTQPVTFLQLVWAASIGLVFFGEPIDIWVVLGGLLIMGAVAFITLREAALRKQAQAPKNAVSHL